MDCQHLERFTAIMGMSKRTIQSWLENKTKFRFSEIRQAGILLDMTGREVDTYFFGIE